MNQSKPETHPANIFVPNPEYIRIKPNSDHIASLHDALQDSKAEWPFPPILAKPIPESMEALLKEGHRYYIIDGHHRVMAAQLAGKPVKAIIYTGITDREALALQCKSNIQNGLALSNAARAKVVKMLVGEDAGKKGIQAEIAKMTGIPYYTVSRLLSAKNPPVAGTEADARTTEGKKKKTPKPFDAESWMKSFLRTMKGWKGERRKIVKSKNFPGGLDKALDAVLDTLNL